MRIRLLLQGAFWILVYLFLTLAPLLVLLLTPTPPGRGFWREFSVALGFAGLGMMGMQFALTARFRRIKAPYGMDIVYQFHRQISIVALTLILAHPLILFVSNPGTLRLLNLVTAPWRARFGVTSVLAVLAVAATSLWRRRLKIGYEAWRVAHALLAVAAVSLALAHIFGVGYYVNTPWKRAFWLGYSGVWVGLLAYVRLIKPALELRKPYTVVDVTPAGGDAWTLALEPAGHRGLRFHPGQFAWLTIGVSPFSDREHPFSIASSAARPERLEFTIKSLGDFTSTIRHIPPGTKVYLDGPHGAFSIDRYGRDEGFVFLAGGIGITPIMSMLRTMADRGDRRPVLLFYANRSLDAATFRDELERLRQRLNLTLIHVLERPPDGWTGETGFLTKEILARHLPANRKQVDYFLCGPPPMMQAVERALRSLGIPPYRIHSERFNLV